MMTKNLAKLATAFLALCPWTLALPFPSPQPQYGCIGSQGELHLVQPLGHLELGKWRCPVAFRYRAANLVSTGWLKGKWTFPLLDGYCLQKDAGIYEMLLLDGSVVTFDNRTGQMKQKGRLVDDGGNQANWAIYIKSEDEIVARNQDGTQLRFVGGLIASAQLPKIGAVRWQRDEREICLLLENEKLLSLAQVDGALVLRFGDETFRIDQTEASFAVERTDGAMVFSATLAIPSDAATLCVRDAVGQVRYTYDVATGIIKSDDNYTYALIRSKAQVPLTQGIMRTDRNGVREGTFFDDETGAYEIYHPDGSHERRYVSFAEGPRFGKIWKLARVSAGKEAIVWRKDFDALGRTSFCRDERGAEYTYRYSSDAAFPRTVTIREPSGSVSEWSYDAVGQVTKRIAGKDTYIYQYTGVPTTLVGVALNGTALYEQYATVK